MKGRFSWHEKRMVAYIVQHGGIADAARASGISYESALRIAQRPEIQAAVVARQRALMVLDLLPTSVAAQREMLTNPKTPASVRRAVARDVQDRVLGLDHAAAMAKEPHEMTPDELAAAIARLEEAAASKAKEIEPPASIETAPRPSILD